MAKSASYEPWQEAAARFGFRSSAAFPLFIGGEIFAVLMVYNSHSDAFDSDEVQLLGDLTFDIGTFLSAQRTEIEKNKLQDALHRASLGTISAVAATIEKRDPYTSGHQHRVAEMSVAIAQELGWAVVRIEGLRLGATIHDIGKIYVPAEILNRPGKLSPSEFAIIKSHPQVGFDILEHTDFPWPIKEMILQHHERIDGSGYPNGLKGDQIIDEAKVIAIADVVEAITSHRPYRPGLGLDVALAEIEAGRGSAYDPAIADTCLKLFRDKGYKVPL
jgi:putative nucleotidyltransferase with HDIG domain